MVSTNALTREECVRLGVTAMNDKTIIAGAETEFEFGFIGKALEVWLRLLGLAT